MADTPSWLQEDTDLSAPPAPPKPARASADSNNNNVPPPVGDVETGKNSGFMSRFSFGGSGSTPEVPETTNRPTATVRESSAKAAPLAPLDVDENTLKAMKVWHLVLRFGYMCAAIFMGVAAGLSLVGQTNVGQAFFALYILSFCLLICCFEVNLSVSYLIILFCKLYTMSM